jgi:hypothetical protein
MYTTGLFIIGFLLCVTAAHADVYKCPDDKGGTIFRNVPCDGAAPEILPSTGPTGIVPSTPGLPRTTSPSTPSSSRHETTDVTCKTLGETAHSLALLRDVGKPASEFLAMFSNAAVKTGGAEGAYWEKVTRDMVLAIYANRWWTPTVARQRIEVECFQRYK